MGKNGSHRLTEGMEKLPDVLGMEWRMVGPGWPEH